MRVMKSIGAHKEPVFTCMKSGNIQYRVSVQFDVTEVTYFVRKTPHLVKVEGEICETPDLAENSAIRNAVLYLGQNHCIEVKDYSSSIIQMCSSAYDWSDVDDLEKLMIKLIEQWEMSIQVCEKFSQYLDYKMIMDVDADVITESGTVYAALEDFIIFIINRFKSIPAYARSEIDRLKSEVEKYSDSFTENYNLINKVRKPSVNLLHFLK